jgi:hypothetical protein
VSAHPRFNNGKSSLSRPEHAGNFAVCSLHASIIAYFVGSRWPWFAVPLIVLTCLAVSTTMCFAFVTSNLSTSYSSCCCHFNRNLFRGSRSDGGYYEMYRSRRRRRRRRRCVLGEIGVTTACPRQQRWPCSATPSQCSPPATRAFRYLSAASDGSILRRLPPNDFSYFASTRW